MSIHDIPYYKVAKQALMNWNGLSEEEANKAIETSGFEELESQVYAVDSMESAINEILRQANIPLAYQEDVKNAMYGAPNFDEYDRDEQYGYLIKSIKREGLDPIQLIMDTLSAVHDGWVKNNAKQYFTKKADRKQQYQFSPLELIGWKEAKSDLLFVKPIVEACNIKVDEKALEELYNARVMQFLQEHQISTADDLSQRIEQGAEFYPALEGQDAIVEALSNPEFVTGTIVPQLEEKGIGDVEKFIAERQPQLTPQDIEAAVQGVTRQGMNEQSNQIKEEFSPNKEHEQSNDEISI